VAWLQAEGMLEIGASGIGFAGASLKCAKVVPAVGIVFMQLESDALLFGGLLGDAAMPECKTDRVRGLRTSGPHKGKARSLPIAIERLASTLHTLCPNSN